MLYDCVIIGAGPSGLSAGLFTTMYGLSVVCLGDVFGGKVNIAPLIFDYPGVSTITGKEFINGLKKQCERVHVETKSVIVDEVEKSPSNEMGLIFTVKTESHEMFIAKTLLLATGNGKKQKVNRGMQLGEKLGVHIENGFIVADDAKRTSVSGVFASGDCTHYPHSVEQLATAVSSGIKAAVGIYEHINHSRPPILWGAAQIPRPQS